MLKQKDVEEAQVKIADYVNYNKEIYYDGNI